MIAREGVTPLLAAILVAVVVLHFYGPLLSLPVWVLAVLVLLMFRDPDRDIPSIPTALVSPADGKVISITNTRDPYLDRPSVHMIVQMHPYGVFTTRSPTEGKVLEPPNLPDNVDTPHGVWLQTDEGDDVVMVMNRGRLNNLPRCYIRFGERVGQGQRCGFVHLGGNIDLYLPEHSRTTVAPGDTVRSGSDVIAKLVHA
ncbi:MAG: phosphatidylserine decarboxylase [Gammaproteobacteria bacterium]